MRQKKNLKKLKRMVNNKMEHEMYLALVEIIERQKMLEQQNLRILKFLGDPTVQEVKPEQQQQQQMQQQQQTVQEEMEEKMLDEELSDDDEPRMTPQPIIAKKKKSWEDEVDDEEQATEFEVMNQRAMEKKQQSKPQQKAYDTVD